MSEQRCEVAARPEDGMAEAMIGDRALRLVSDCLSDRPRAVTDLGGEAGR